MSKLALFSLDTLVNLPRLYANALAKTFEGAVSREEILERLADSGLDFRTVIDNICLARQWTGYARVPAQGPTLQSVTESIAFFKESSGLSKAFIGYLPVGAHGCVKKYAFETVRAARNLDYKTGIFHTISQETVESIVRNTKLKVDVVVGPEYEKKARELIEKAKRKASARETWLIVKAVPSRLDYRKIAEETGAHYIECNETSEAPLARVQAVLSPSAGNPQ